MARLDEEGSGDGLGVYYVAEGGEVREVEGRPEYQSSTL